MKVWVDPTRCQGHGLCKMIAPESFELSEIDGHSTAVSTTVTAGQEDLVIEAMRSCPERAIFVNGLNSGGEEASGTGQPDWTEE